VHKEKNGELNLVCSFWAYCNFIYDWCWF